MLDWNDFDKFAGIIKKYMMPRGEGTTMASQVVTAVNKLVYKWFNDGDVFDNTSLLEGWANDLSSYANWLDAHTDASSVLDYVYEVDEESYADLLYALCEKVLDPEKLAAMNLLDAVGSIYDCDGRFMFICKDEDED